MYTNYSLLFIPKWHNKKFLLVIFFLILKVQLYECFLAVQDDDRRLWAEEACNIILHLEGFADCRVRTGQAYWYYEECVETACGYVHL